LLKETSIIPVIFETEKQAGGISKTLEYKGNRIDIGGHRFFTKIKDVNDLWREFLIEQGSPSIDDILLQTNRTFVGQANPEEVDNVFLLRRRVSRIYYLRKFFDYPVSLKLQTIKNMGLMRTFKVGFGYIGTKFHKRKEDNLENFYINRFGKPLYRMFFESYTAKVWGLPPAQIDASWGAQRVKGLSLWKAITSIFKKEKETSLIEEFHYPKYGPGQLYELMAEKIIELGGVIHYNTTVEKINVENNKVVSVVANGQTYESDYFISSMAIKDLIHGLPNVPEEISYIGENLPYRDFITVGLLCNKLKIKNQTKIKTLSELVPDCWIYLQEPDVKIGRLQIFNNWSPYLVKDFKNTVWIGLEYFCNEGDELWNKENFEDFAKTELEKIGIIDSSDVIDAVQYRIKKAYPAYFGVYKQFDLVKNYLLTIENLYCVGRNGQHRYNNMDHSIMTAIKAVEVIIENSDPASIWKINTEEEYHEGKK
jgi:protoporphyrinogen oxidase